MNRTSLRDRFFSDHPQPVCNDIRRQRYAQANEQTADDIRQRLAGAFASVEPTPHRSRRQREFLSAMRYGFIPGGRIHAAAGTSLAATLISCFVQPIAPQRQGRDAHGRPGVEAALREMASTLQMGGRAGVNLSDLPARSIAGHTSVSRMRSCKRLDPIHTDRMRLHTDGHGSFRPPSTLATPGWCSSIR